MSHYFNNGVRTPRGDAEHMNPPGSGERRRVWRRLRDVQQNEKEDAIMQIAVDLLKLNADPGMGRVAAVALLCALPRDEAELAVDEWRAVLRVRDADVESAVNPAEGNEAQAFILSMNALAAKTRAAANPGGDGDGGGSGAS